MVYTIIIIINALRFKRSFLSITTLNTGMSHLAVLSLRIATATHNFKWTQIRQICLISDQPFANLDA